MEHNLDPISASALGEPRKAASCVIFWRKATCGSHSNPNSTNLRLPLVPLSALWPRRPKTALKLSLRLLKLHSPRKLLRRFRLRDGRRHTSTRLSASSRLSVGASRGSNHLWSKHALECTSFFGILVGLTAAGIHLSFEQALMFNGSDPIIAAILAAFIQNLKPASRDTSFVQSPPSFRPSDKSSNVLYFQSSCRKAST